MLRLRGQSKEYQSNFNEDSMLILSSDKNLPDPLKQKYAYIIEDEEKEIPKNFGAYVTFDNQIFALNNENNFYLIPDYMNYLLPGDIVNFKSDGHIWAVFRESARYNTFLLTERCNHYCLMCSQPPKSREDSWLLDIAKKAVELIPRSTQRIGFSGGEPTIYKEGLIDLIEKCAGYLPYTGIDILTNGRAFANSEYSKMLQNADHKDCMICIPLYSDVPELHDYVVQSEDAFDETIKGILNLKALNQKVEIRIVIHKQTIDRLVKTCEYIARNLLFVDHVALMGLEITGFTRANLDDLWIDPYEYKDILSEAVDVLNRYKIPASVYNHQLCTVNDDVINNYVHSISDWKNEYITECKNCSKRHECGGFFSSQVLYRHSDHIKAFE
tara:strand:- start:171 stop:1325 length:1155 start_codon:yes stop_codon:yes gene_type:complete